MTLALAPWCPAAVLVDQTVPPSLVVPVAVAGAVLAALLLLALLASRPGGAPPLLKRGLALAGGLVALWAAAALVVALRVQALQDELRVRQAGFASLAARSTGGLDALTVPVGPCVDSLVAGGATSLVGYLVVPPRVGVPREQLPRPGYPRLLVPSDTGSVSLASVPAPPRAAGALPMLFVRATATPPWRWRDLLAPPGNRLSVVRYLVVAAVREYDARDGRIDSAVAVLPSEGGSAVCEGTFSVQIPAEAGGRFPLASTLEASAFSAICRAGGAAFCDHVRAFAPLATAGPAGP